ncbi:hypothetical protein SDC9_114108 [bioreactor metagenome]|uniref:Uncharacterized protein n=1 Tax=bioreactor metagenome TaxID=1076179 RepID=A0A645BRE6_9ZZZZ|nr:hypothetical protein [Anaerotignum propionicum]MEA5056456.1 hypothetical protein [Anaerotignum propionicum]
MNTIEDYIEQIKNLSLEELHLFQEHILKEKDSRNPQKYIYTHDCCGYSNYHMNKYKHYSKRITAIDDSKTNGYAFQGEFLNVRKENLIPDGSYILEVCNMSLKLYKINKESKELVLEGYSNMFVSFIKEAKELTKM